MPAEPIGNTEDLEGLRIGDPTALPFTREGTNDPGSREIRSRRPRLARLVDRAPTTASRATPRELKTIARVADSPSGVDETVRSR